jgi:DNA-binding Lrp family transcriptional regulator
MCKQDPKKVLFYCKLCDVAQEGESMKVEVIVRFKDLTADGVIREPGVILDVSEERADKLLGMGLVKIVEDTAEEPAKEAVENAAEEPQEASKKTTRKRTAKTETQ